MPAERRRQLHVEQLAGRASGALQTELRFLVMRMHDRPHRRIRHHIPDRLVGRLLDVVGQRVDQEDLVARRDLQQRELRLVGALRNKLGVEPHHPLGANAVGEFCDIFVSVEQLFAGPGGASIPQGHMQLASLRTIALRIATTR